MKKKQTQKIRQIAGMALLLLTMSTYAQNSYTFTTAGATGSLGPTQTEVNTAYLSTNLNGSVDVNPQGIQNFTIPISGDYRIEAYGAQGYGTFGGRGAVMIGDFNLSAGTVLKIIAGQTATLNNTSYSNQFGGGGGSFVTYANNTPLIIAGGGGGSHASSFVSNADGTTSTSGNDGINGTTNAAGGTGGQGGSSAANLADGGGGLLGDGAGTYAGGLAFVNGATGGGYRGIGGFGGGAGTGSFNDTRCGGGGGYSGGGGSHQSGSAGAPVGGGGGSYNNGANQQNTSGANLGDGKVIITRLCDVEVNASANPICFGDSVVLSTNAGSNISWSSGSSSNSITVAPSSNTSYTVSGISSSSTSCSSTLVITVSVNPLPQLSAVSIPSVLCRGNSGTVTADGAVSYSWNPGAGNDMSITVNPQSTTVYTITGASPEGCTDQHTVAMVVDNTNIATSPDTAICAGDPVYLRASGANNYLWSNGALFPNILAYPSANTVYLVNGVNIHGCTIGSSVEVTVNQKPQVMITAENTVVCKGDAVELTAHGADSYIWEHGDSGPSSSPVPAIDVPTQYQVTGTNNNGCTGTASITIQVNLCTGLAENKQAIFHVFPNPARDFISIESDAGIKHITVSDVSGRKLFGISTEEMKIQIPLQNYSAGMYYISINNKVFKVIKE